MTTLNAGGWPESFRVTDNATGAVLITFKLLFEHH
jgi:hypothetical protein